MAEWLRGGRPLPDPYMAEPILAIQTHLMNMYSMLTLT